MTPIRACFALLPVALLFAATGCTTIASSTNVLSDVRVVEESALALGIPAAQLQLVNRRTEGTHTYVQLKSRDQREFTCIVNGGNLLSFGMTNPPSCARSGEPVKAAPFGR